MQARIAFFFCLWLVACTATPSEIPPTATAIPSCGDWQSMDTNFTCIILDDALLIQSGIEQITFRAYEASLVVHGTVLLLEDAMIRIMVLEGDAIISARGQNRIVSTGQEVSLTITEQRAAAPSDIQSIEYLPDSIPLDDLARSIDETALIIVETPVPTAIPTEETENCAIPDGWTATYTIESGDTLARIATRYELTIEELAEGNCLTNLSWIIVGEELAVPVNESETEIAPVETGSIGFRADAYLLEAGSCTILRWDAFNAVSIFLEDEPVRESSSQEVCPAESTSYRLRVILNNEVEEVREITLSIQE